MDMTATLRRDRRKDASNMTQPAANNPGDGTIPYHQVYFGCCNRTVMTREDVAQPKYCPFCGRAGDGKQQEARTPDLDAAIGNVLDHWEQVPNDLQTDPGYEALHNALKKLYECRVRQPSHASGEPSRAMVEETETDCPCGNYGKETVISLIQEARQAMAEKAAQHVMCPSARSMEYFCTVCEWKAGGSLAEAVRSFCEHIRSLAGAEPQPKETK